MRAKRIIPATIALLGILTIALYAVSQEKPSGAKENKAAKGDKQPKADEDQTRSADRKAIGQVSKDFVAAYNKADAQALARLWTAEGEYIVDDGTALRGRAAIEKAYQKFFAANPNLKLKERSESLRFVSRDTAIEEGYARTEKEKNNPVDTSRYSALYVREKGRWRLAVVREWPDEGVTLREVAWLIGTWTAKTKDGEVRTTYSWGLGKKFIQVRITIKEKDRTVTGTQFIARDPRTDQLRSWVFESEGGFGEAVWTLDGKRWVLEAGGVQADGSELSATNILTRTGRDAFTWQSVDRTVDGEEVPDLPPVKVTRVK
jgi:uncharacterized protein (TIGR02246 family)